MQCYKERNTYPMNRVFYLHNERNIMANGPCFVELTKAGIKWALYVIIRITYVLRFQYGFILVPHICIMELHTNTALYFDSTLFLRVNSSFIQKYRNWFSPWIMRNIIGDFKREHTIHVYTRFTSRIDDSIIKYRKNIPSKSYDKASLYIDLR